LSIADFRKERFLYALVGIFAVCSTCVGSHNPGKNSKTVIATFRQPASAPNKAVDATAAVAMRLNQLGCVAMDVSGSCEE
jgi:hypothetical protein